VIGTVDSITAMTRKQIHSFYRRRYRPEQIVVSAAGNLDHAAVVRMVRRAFRDAGFLDGTAEPAPPRRGERSIPIGGPTIEVVTKDTEQAHVILGTRGIPRHDERRFALGVLNHALGGGMSSRLFQEVRERRGLAYSVYSYSTQFADAGLFGVYAGCARKRVGEVLGVIRDELADVAAAGLSDEEVARGKGMLKGATVLGLEDTGSRMSRIGKGELVYGDVLDIDDLLGRIDAVSVDDVRSIASELLARPMSLGAIGPFDGHDFSEAVAS
jgi:predicted Zn-dependent peptidase